MKQAGFWPNKHIFDYGRSDEKCSGVVPELLISQQTTGDREAMMIGPELAMINNKTPQSVISVFPVIFTGYYYPFKPF